MSDPLSEEEARRQELADFLRTRREALQPEDVGVPRRGRRRVKGLRRHEVADAAAMSVTWYTWMEQGRDIRATPQVIDALARALLLGPDEHRYLRRLAGIPITTPDSHPAEAGSDLVALVEGFSPHPAHLMLPTTDLVAWNDAYRKLFSDPDVLDEEHRNGLWIQIMRPEVREHLANWEDETKDAIARFRAEAGKYPGDARFKAIIDELSGCSEFFKLAWDRHEVQGFTSHTEVFNHPDAGEVRARLIQLRPLDAPNMTLMVHWLIDEESRDRVAALLG